jgi:hypothetical protein
MAMKNYKVTETNGHEAYYQFDDATELGRTQLKAFQDAIDDANSPVLTIEPGDPKPIN